MPFKRWEGLVAFVILEAIPVGTTVPSGHNRTWQVSGERQDTWPSMLGGGGGVDNSLTLLPCMLLGTTTKTKLQNKPKGVRLRTSQIVEVLSNDRRNERFNRGYQQCMQCPFTVRTGESFVLEVKIDNKCRIRKTFDY